MPTRDEERLQELLLAEIERDEKRAQRHRKVLAELEPRIRGARAYFSARFGESALPDHLRGEAEESVTAGVPVRKRKRFGHADLCAIAITEAGETGQPVTVDHVRRLVIGAQFADVTVTYPTRQTLVSTLNRSPLFGREGGGYFILLKPYPREAVPEKHRHKLAGASAGNEETQGGNPVAQGSEAAPADLSDL